MHIVTINTDAGFYSTHKVGSYAYWIKSTGLFLIGSGVFKHPVFSPLEAEIKSIINALIVLEKSKFKQVNKLIINCDNIYAVPKVAGNAMQKLLAEYLCDFQLSLGYGQFITPFYEFRHVKAHSGTGSLRQYVNDWCDKQCTKQLKEWKKRKTVSI